MTWGSITFDPVLVGPVCQGSLATMDGHLYFSNPASTRSRSELTVRRSDDGGVTWSRSLVIQPNKSSGYSSLVADGAVGGILYEHGACEIGFESFPLSLETE